jgi:hypothetical protein
MVYKVFNCIIKYKTDFKAIELSIGKPNIFKKLINFIKLLGNKVA